MKPRPHDPLRLDVAAFAAAGAELSGNWPMQTMPRLTRSQTAPQDVAFAPVQWSARGESRAVRGGAAQIWLQIGAQTEVWLACQRCLQPYKTTVEVITSLHFVRDEAEAEALDPDSEHDVLALTGALNLRELIEDELLLALPIAPRHEVCPQPLPVAPAQPGLAEAPAASPFAALAGLKRGAG